VRLFLAIGTLLAIAASPTAGQTPRGSENPPPATLSDREAHRAAALERLFESLKQAASPEVARGVEVMIWSLWLESGRDDLDERMTLAIQSMNAQDYPAARSHLTDIIALKPDFAEAWNKRATVYFLEGDYTQSLADIERVLELEPRHFGALSGLGMILDRIGQKEGALKAFRKALAIHPQMPAVRLRVEELSVDLEGKEL
jgi:tetratricopeptide (TPR) repeat protein